MFKKTIALVAVLGFSAAVNAEVLTGTLQRIKETGEIRLGHRDVSYPFSYLNNEGKPIGFAMDICEKIVADVSKKIGQNIKIVYRPVVLSTQIPLLQNESVDIICGPATNTLERQKQVAFSNSIFMTNISAIVKSESDIQSLKDLSGKSVSVTAASTAQGLWAQYQQENGIKSNVLVNPDHAQSFLMLTSGRANAFLMDDVQLYALRAGQAKPDSYRILSDALRTEPYGLMMRKNDPKFKSLVDSTLGDLFTNGEFSRLYAKWFESPIPPKELNLNFPISAGLKSAIESPNDKGI